VGSCEDAGKWEKGKVRKEVGSGKAEIGNERR
jgi:hypothetical protein